MLRISALSVSQVSTDELEQCWACARACRHASRPFPGSVHLYADRPIGNYTEIEGENFFKPKMLLEIVPVMPIFQ